MSGSWRRRREIGRDINLLDRALEATSSTYPSPLPHPQLRRVLWESFTGGDIAYAPEPLTLDAKATSMRSSGGRHTTAPT